MLWRLYILSILTRDDRNLQDPILTLTQVVIKLWETTKEDMFDHSEPLSRINLDDTQQAIKKYRDFKQKALSRESYTPWTRFMLVNVALHLTNSLLDQYQSNSSQEPQNNANEGTEHADEQVNDQSTEDIV